MKEKININFKKREKLYYFLLFLVFSTVIISQIAMRFSGMMGYFSAIETFEGEFVTDDGMFNKTEIILEFDGELISSMPEIYTNGEKSGFVDVPKKKLLIETDSVVEVFLPEAIENARVNVVCRDSDVINYLKGYPIELEKGFNTVARIGFK